MAIFGSKNQQEIESEIVKIDTTSAGIQAAVEQAEELKEKIRQLPGVEEKDVGFLMLQAIDEAAKAKGGKLETVWASYPQPLKDALVYTPAELRRNQTLTILGTAVSMASFVGAWLLGGYAVFRAIPIARKYVVAAEAALAAGSDATAASLLTLMRTRIGIKIAFMGVSMAFLTATGFGVNMAVNNWNDVFHWGPTLGLQGIRDLLLGDTKTASARTTGTAPVSTFVPTITKLREAKPKFFIGTVLGGRVADVDDFVRHVDDEITDEEDLMTDVVINLQKWLTALPGILTYEIQVKNTPFDENNVKLNGMWATLDMYISTKFGKRVFIDMILLGPIDPVKYWPDTRMTESLRLKITDELTPTILKPQLSPDGKIRTVDSQGAVVELFPEETITPAIPPVEETITPAIPPVERTAPPVIEEQTSSPVKLGPVQTTTPEQPKPPVIGPVQLPADKPFAGESIESFERRTGLQVLRTGNLKGCWFKKTFPFEGVCHEDFKREINNEPKLDLTPPVKLGPIQTPTEKFKVGGFYHVNTPGSVLHGREAPNTSATILERLNDREEVSIINFAGEADGHKWARIRRSADGKGLFVALTFLD